MKFVLAGYGSRGDVEPCAAAGRELLRRGHDVHIAVPPNMLGMAEAAGLAAVSYGPDSQEQLDSAADFVRRLGDPIRALPQVIEHVARVKAEKAATLTSLANGADLLLAGMNEQGLAANVAEYQGIPLAALHYFPAQIWSSGQLYSRVTKAADEAQRRALGLPASTAAATGRPLEIQAYDEFCLPGPAAQLGDDRRPFVGALTLELPADADDEVLSWITAGTPPIYFGFGSTAVATAADTVGMISAACAQLGERALICSGSNDFTDIAHGDHVKVVTAVSHAAVFPVCRAVVHHGGAGTTAAGMRAGTPTLILWLWLDQPLWAEAVTRLKVGSGRRFSDTTEETLVADLRLILDSRCLIGARAVAGRLAQPAESVASAADLLEHAARQGRG